MKIFLTLTAAAATTTTVRLISILAIIFLLLKPIMSFGLGGPSYLNQQQQQQQHRTLALLLSYDGGGGGRFCDQNKEGNGGCDDDRHEYRDIYNEVVNRYVQNLIAQPIGSRSNMAASVAIDTDEGEHALGQVAMFSMQLQPQQGPKILPKLFSGAVPDVNLIRHKLNRQMPPHVRVCRAAVLNGILHADTGIEGIQCRYMVCDWNIDIPLLSGCHWHVPQPKGRRLDVKAMIYAAEKLCMEGNPSAIAISFDPCITSSSKCNGGAVCQLESIRIIETIGAPGRFEFVFKGDRFLYQMVKGFVRALVAIGEKRLYPNELLLLGKAKQLQSCFLTPKLRGMPYAPSHGLCLEHVQYNSSDYPFQGDAVIASSSDGFYDRTTTVDDASSIACRYYKQVECNI